MDFTIHQIGLIAMFVSGFMSGVFIGVSVYRIINNRKSLGQFREKK